MQRLFYVIVCTLTLLAANRIHAQQRDDAQAGKVQFLTLDGVTITAGDPERQDGQPRTRTAAVALAGRLVAMRLLLPLDASAAAFAAMDADTNRAADAVRLLPVAAPPHTYYPSRDFNVRPFVKNAGEFRAYAVKVASDIAAIFLGEDDDTEALLAAYGREDLQVSRLALGACLREWNRRRPNARGESPCHRNPYAMLKPRDARVQKAFVENVEQCATAVIRVNKGAVLDLADQLIIELPTTSEAYAKDGGHRPEIAATFESFAEKHVLVMPTDASVPGLSKQCSMRK